MSELLTNLLSDIPDDVSSDNGGNTNEESESPEEVEEKNDETTISDGQEETEDEAEEETEIDQEEEEEKEDGDEEEDDDDDDEIEDIHLDDDTVLSFDGNEVNLGELKEAWSQREILGKWANILQENPVAAMVELVGPDATWKHIEKFIEERVNENNMSEDDKKIRDVERRVKEAEQKAKDYEDQVKAAEQQKATTEYHSFLTKEVPGIFKDHGLVNREAAYDLMKVHLYHLHESEGRIATKEDLISFSKKIQKTLGIKKSKPKNKLPPAPGSADYRKGDMASKKKAKAKIPIEDYLSALREGNDILAD